MSSQSCLKASDKENSDHLFVVATIVPNGSGFNGLMAWFCQFLHLIGNGISPLPEHSQPNSCAQHSQPKEDNFLMVSQVAADDQVDLFGIIDAWIWLVWHGQVQHLADWIPAGSQLIDEKPLLWNCGLDIICPGSVYSSGLFLGIGFGILKGKQQILFISFFK